MQFIKTTNLRATSTKPARIKATASYAKESFTLDYNDDIFLGKTHLEKHAEVAKLLCVNLGWKGTLVAGSFLGGYYFVFSKFENFKLESFEIK